LQPAGAVLALLATLAGVGAAAAAGPTLERVRAENLVRCGAAARPGLFEETARGPEGLLVDLCRAVGVAAAGPSVKVEMSAYESEASFEAARAGRDDVVFLSGGEIAAEKLAGALTPGPPAFYETIALMVPGAAAATRPADLAGQPICFLQGDAAHRALEGFFAAQNLSFERAGFQEPEELYDAFDSGYCRALAGEATTLAEVRLEGENKRRGARILAEPLATFPILAATGASDGAWSALVFWTLEALVAADRPQRPWSAGGLAALPIDAAALGLSADRLRDALTATGGYAEVYKRHVGEASPLALPFGANARVEEGGLMAPPYAE
jgi:general L-amino acid transport system substrate-binding protein